MTCLTQYCLTLQVQIQELKQAHNPSAAKLRSMMLDPAVNLMFERMKKEVESCKEKLEQAQNDLAAWKFTPDRCVSGIHLPLIALTEIATGK